MNGNGNDRWDALMTRQAVALTDFESRFIEDLKTKGSSFDEHDARYFAAEDLVSRIEEMQPGASL